MTIVISRYGEHIDLSAPVLSDEALVGMLVHGRYDRDALQHEFQISPIFLDPKETPPWKILIQYPFKEDTTINDAAVRLEEEFAARAVTELGDLLQIFAMRLLMVEYKYFDKTLDMVRQECCAYVDDLLEAGRLDPGNPSIREFDLELGYQGYAFPLTKKTRASFILIREHLDTARRTAFERKLPAIADELLAALEGGTFYDLVAPSEKGSNKYASIPVLHGIDPARFAAAWLALPAESWRDVKYALEERYREGRFAERFGVEKAWVDAVANELKRREASMSGFAAARLRWIYPRVFPPFSNDQTTDQ